MADMVWIKTDPNWKRSAMAVSTGCSMCGLTMWDVEEKRIKSEQVRRMVADSPTIESLMGNAKMPMAL
jgi:hypothetical protein